MSPHVVARPKSPKTIRSIRPIRVRVFAVLVGLTLPALLAEIGLRFLVPGLGSPRLPLTYNLSRLENSGIGNLAEMFDPDLGWVSSPNYDRRVEGVRYRNNADGQRADRQYTPISAVGIHRLSAYGDSYTYCADSELEDCWTRRLERQLPGTEVLNFGVPAYGPDQALLRYMRGGAAWNSCAVLIGLLVENVYRVINRFRPFYVPEYGGDIPLAKPRFIISSGQLTLLPNPARSVNDLRNPVWVEENLGSGDAFYFPGTFAANPLDRFELVRLARTAAYRRDRYMLWSQYYEEHIFRPGSEAFEVLAAVLLQFAAQVRADGATPVVLVFPTKTTIASFLEKGAKPHTPLLERLQQQGVPVIDFTEALVEQSKILGFDSLMAVHFLPRGNQLVASRLAEQVPGLTAETCSNR